MELRVGESCILRKTTTPGWAVGATYRCPVACLLGPRQHSGQW